MFRKDNERDSSDDEYHSSPLHRHLGASEEESKRAAKRMYRLINGGISKLSPEDSLRFLLKEAESSNVTQREIIEKLAKNADTEEALQNLTDDSEDEKATEYIKKLSVRLKDEKQEKSFFHWRNLNAFVEYLFEKMHMQWRAILVTICLFIWKTNFWFSVLGFSSLPTQNPRSHLSGSIH